MNEQAKELDPGIVRKRAAVKRWFSRYDSAKRKWDQDFDRMRENMEFVTGIQWPEQQSIRDADERYVANMTLRMVSQKVAMLYARNPTVEAVRRKRLDFQIWDGSIDSLTSAFQRMEQGRMLGLPDMGSEALIQDFMQGRQQQELVEKVCRTLEIVDQYDIDTGTPDFKEQMKQLVRRVVICGVGYVRPTFVREGSPGVSTVDTRHSLVDRAKLMALISTKIVDDGLDVDDPEVETLKSLALSMGVSASNEDDYELSERVEHDFLPATSVIPDERCRHLKGFVAARWVFVEYNLQPDEINAMFGLSGDDRVSPSVDSDSDGEQSRPELDDEGDPARKGKTTLVEVIDYQTKTHCYIAKGYKDYVREPAPFDPLCPGFWPLVSLTFNDIESDDSCERASIFPPSDVDLILDPQREWNRTREANRDQRNANAPKYVVRKGLLSPNDIEKLRKAVPNSVVELENVPSDLQPSQLVQVLQVAAIDPALYDTSSLEQDFLLAGGMQQANVGPAQPDVTATVGTIAEQSRMTVSSSNVDDLDEFLSKLAMMRGHLRLQSMSEAYVKRIAGPGAAWPVLDKQDFLTQIYLTIVAASSGRPNRALEIANFERIAPIMLQSGANPIAIIEEAVRRLGDDRLDVQKFYPLPGMMPQTASAAGPPGPQATPNSQGPPGASNRVSQPSGPEQPLQPTQSGMAMPLPAA